MTDLVVIGAGASGLSVAREAVRRGCSVAVVERDDAVGGLARSHDVDGFRLDHVAHRWVPKTPLVHDVLRDTLGDDLCRRVRSHVIRLDGRYVGHPFSLTEFIAAQGAGRRWSIAGDVLAHRALQRFRGSPVTFADYVHANFGRAAYHLYFGPHYEKTTGIPPDRLLASYAERFVGSPAGEVVRAALGQPTPPTPERSFFYPRLGSGQVWERMADAVCEAGAELRLEATAREVERAPDGCTVRAVDGEGRQVELQARKVVSTIPLPDLVSMVRPSAPEALVTAGSALRRLALVCVYVLARMPRVLPNDAIYYPDPAVDFYILEDFSYLSPGMAPPGCAAVCAAMVDWDRRYWNRSDQDLVAMVREQMAQVGHPVPEAEFLGAHVERVADARPDPSTTGRDTVAALLRFTNRDGLISVGRQGTLTPLMTMDAAVELGAPTLDALGL
jgi:protoporphyrinogen oxidase